MVKTVLKKLINSPIITSIFALTFFFAVPFLVIFLLPLFVWSQRHHLFSSLLICQIYQRWENEFCFWNISSFSWEILIGGEVSDPGFFFSLMLNFATYFEISCDNCALSCVSDAGFHSCFFERDLDSLLGIVKGY